MTRFAASSVDEERRLNLKHKSKQMLGLGNIGTTSIDSTVVGSVLISAVRHEASDYTAPAA